MVKYDGPYKGNEIFKSFTKTWHNKPYPAISTSRHELSAAGKVVFITGGGSGIGKATAIAFAHAGAKVVAIFGRRVGCLQLAGEEISKANPNTTVVTERADISQRQSLETAFTNARNNAGGARINIFVNNAGSLKPLSPVTTYSEKDLRDSIESNLIGSFNAIQLAAPMLASDAKILIVSSGIGHTNPTPGFWVYASLKIAIIKLFDYLEADNPDLSVFNIQPGVIETDLNSVFEFPGEDDVNLPGCFNVWIASPEGGFLKGKFVWTNWDVDELKAHAEEIRESMLLRVSLNGLPI